MNVLRLIFCAVLLAASALVAPGKPPGANKEAKKPSPSPAPTVADHPADPTLLRWLLLQNGGPDAASVSWPALVRAAAGRQVFPLDPADPDAAATVARIGAALDGLLPQLNRPDGPLRAAAPLTAGEIAARITEELRPALHASADAAPGENVYPTLRLVNAPDGRPYYLAVTLYPSGERESALRAITFRAAESAPRLPADGCCLLVAVEHNGKSGRELALLNWELIDLAKVSLRCTVVFDADQNAVHAPGATLTDGRKGRD